MYKSAISPAIYWMVASGQVLQIFGVMLVKLSMTLYILHLQGPVYVIGRWILICAAVINVGLIYASALRQNRRRSFAKVRLRN